MSLRTALESTLSREDAGTEIDYITRGADHSQWSSNTASAWKARWLITGKSLLRCDLPDDSYVVGSVIAGRAVKVAARVHNDIALGVAAVCTTRKAVEHGCDPSMARRHQLEDGAAITEAAHRGSVNVTGGIQAHRGI